MANWWQLYVAWWSESTNWSTYAPYALGILKNFTLQSKCISLSFLEFNYFQTIKSFRYKPEVGDIVVGRVIEVCRKFFFFETDLIDLAYLYNFFSRLLQSGGDWKLISARTQF